MKVVIDAGASNPEDGLFCVCPVEQDDSGGPSAIATEMLMAEDIKRRYEVAKQSGRLTVDERNPLR